MSARAAFGPILAIVAALSLLALPAIAADLTADQIIERSTANRTVSNSVQTMTMSIFDKQGRSRVRTITSKVKQGEDGQSRSHVQFDAPEDVAGVQFLTIGKAEGEDEQHLFMPAIGQRNQISGGSRKGKFMGSDFTFEDLSVGGSTDQGTHKLIGTEAIEVDGGSAEAFRIETVPNEDTSSAYSKIVTWITTADFMPRKVEFHDSKGALIKRMTIEEIKPDGDMIVPTKTTMADLKRGTKTEIVVTEYRVNVPPEELPDAMFTPAYLESEG